MAASAGRDGSISTQTFPSGSSEAARRPDRPLSGSVSVKQPFVATGTRPGGGVQIRWRSPWRTSGPTEKVSGEARSPAFTALDKLVLRRSAFVRHQLSRLRGADVNGRVCPRASEAPAATRNRAHKRFAAWPPARFEWAARSAARQRGRHARDDRPNGRRLRTWR